MNDTNIYINKLKKMQDQIEGKAHLMKTEELINFVKITIDAAIKREEAYVLAEKLQKDLQKINSRESMLGLDHKQMVVLSDMQFAFKSYGGLPFEDKYFRRKEERYLFEIPLFRRAQILQRYYTWLLEEI